VLQLARVCFRYFKRILQVFHLDVAYVVVLYTYVATCKCVFQMFQLFHLDVAYVAVSIYVCCKSICSECFTYKRRMLEVFYLNVADIAVVINICCKCMFQLFHLISVGCSRCCYPRALTHGNARCMHPSSAAYLYHVG
jgi:hypothetical protein